MHKNAEFGIDKAIHFIFNSYAISKGANDWNSCLCHACEGGNMEIVNLMIKKGAICWSGGLFRACQ